jgi:lipopolysaccharide biosynthesis glycosyltransferase
LAKTILAKYEERGLISKNYSSVIKDYPDNFIDFIYIDGNHSYEGCKYDLELSWRKLKVGGILAGHDYLNTDNILQNGKTVPCDIKVKKAVDEFASKYKLKINVTKENFPSFYIFKTKKNKIKKTKNCIVTIAIGDNKIYPICTKSIEDYAKKINVDYKIIKDNQYPLPHLNKLRIKNLLNIYDRILFLDADILVSPKAPDIFHLHKDNSKLYIFNEGKYIDRKNTVIKTAHFFNFKNWSMNKIGYNYYNTGVMLLSKKQKKLFEKFDLELYLKNQELHDFYEQSYLNYIIQKYKIKIEELNPEWNRMSHLGFEGRLNAYFIHYAGGWYGNGTTEATINLLNDDFQKLKSNI